MSLTSTTAPGSTFASRSELADHYKSDWHKYNLKRREAGLTLLEEKEFKARLEAALALRKEKEKKTGTDHIKNINKKDYSKKKQNKKTNHNKVNNNNAVISSSDDTKMEEEEKPSEEDNDNNIINNDETTETTTRSSRLPAALVESQENPEIDPKQSLFDQHQSDTLEKNVEYMQKEFGFFLPDQDCLVDLEGLLGYAHEKIKLGHYCLYCEK
jgi:pre-60S factor REI1